MAQRLATEVKACLHLSEADLAAFLSLLSEHQVAAEVRVFENGNQEVCVQDEAGEAVVLSIQREGRAYVCRGSCRISNPKLANAMRRAISMFKGNAVMHRFYPSYIVTYDYEQGAVKWIVERSGTETRLIYERKDTLGQLQRLIRQTRVESDVANIQRRIDALLDQRNATPDRYARKAIDEQLKRLSQELFRLEA